MTQHDGYENQHITGCDCDGEFRILEHAERDLNVTTSFNYENPEQPDVENTPFPPGSFNGSGTSCRGDFKLPRQDTKGLK